MRPIKFIVLGMMLLFATKPVGAAPTESSKGAVLFGVDIDGYMPDKEGWRRELLLVLENRLKESGYSVVRMPPPTMCKEQSCIEQTVNSLGNEIGLYVSINGENQHPAGFLINIKLYRRDAKFQFRSREAKCIGCSEYKARDMLEAQFNKLFTDSPDTANAKTGTTNGKKIGFYVMGALGSALAVTGAVGLGLSLKDHNNASCSTNPPSPFECAFFHDNTKSIATFGALLGVGAVLAPIGFILAAREEHKPSVAFSFSGSSLVLSGEF